MALQTKQEEQVKLTLVQYCDLSATLGLVLTKKTQIYLVSYIMNLIQFFLITLENIKYLT